MLSSDFLQVMFAWQEIHCVFIGAEIKRKHHLNKEIVILSKTCSCSLVGRAWALSTEGPGPDFTKQILT